MTADDVVRRAIRDNDQVAFTYATSGGPQDRAFIGNPNGSIDDIAGICDGTGLILGLMPHPERHVSALQHPAWARVGAGAEVGSGLKIFRNGVQFVASSAISST